MLEADRIPPAVTPSFWRPERKAWAIMLLAFAVFCGLTSGALYGGYRVFAAPRAGYVTAQVVQPNAAFLQRSGLVRTEMLEQNADLALGDRISTSPAALMGVAARLRVGETGVALWPGTTLLVEPGPAVLPRLRLEGGQAVIDVPRGGRSLFVASPFLQQQVELTAPGRYRLRAFSVDSPITAIAERNMVPGVEVAVDSGVARMGESAIPAGKRLVTSGTVRQEPNRWSLVRDGNFSAFSQDEYRATFYSDVDVRRADTWHVTREALAQGANARSGFFYVEQACDDDMAGERTCHNVVRLARLGGNEKPSSTGINQQIAAEVAAYRKVMLEADVRIDHQSLSKGGANGTECPLFAQVTYDTGSEPNLSQWFCFWAYDYGNGETSAQPYITSTKIEPQTWYHFRVDLRAMFPDLRVIQRLIFYSNGHDYDAKIADVALWGEGLTDTRQP